MSIPAVISIIAPLSIVDFVLERRIQVFRDQNPNIALLFNSSLNTDTIPTMYLQFAPDADPTMLTREIGAVTINIYRHKLSNALELLPDIVANLDSNLTLNYPYHSPNAHSLWLSIHPSSGHAAGVRQALDWVESCVQSMSWLSDTKLVKAPPFTT